MADDTIFRIAQTQGSKLLKSGHVLPEKKPMTFDEINAEIKRLEALRDALPKEWPQPKDRVYFLNHDGGVMENIYSNNEAVNLALERGLIFRTIEEAKNADKKRIAIAEWNRLAGDQSWVDWDDTATQKNYPFYNHSSKKWGVECAYHLQHWPFAHHKTYEDCKAAIKDMGERIDWILL